MPRGVCIFSKAGFEKIGGWIWLPLNGAILKIHSSEFSRFRDPLVRRRSYQKAVLFLYFFAITSTRRVKKNQEGGCQLRVFEINAAANPVFVYFR